MKDFIHPELPLDAQTAETTGSESPSAGKKARRKKPRAKPKPVAEPEAGTPGHVGDGEPEQRDDDPAAAAWDHKNEFAEGTLGNDAREKVRTATHALRPIMRAFERHELSIGRSQESLRKALARTYVWATALRGEPEVINALLAERRIRNSKPLRDNVFLAAVRLACPAEAVDTVTRWAGALAFGAASGCAPEEIAKFLRNRGIREAADGWTELRRSGKRQGDRPKAAKPHPFDLMRSTLRAFALPDDPVLADVGNGPFLIIAERRQDGVVGYAALKDERLTRMAAKSVMATAKATTKSSAAR